MSYNAIKGVNRIPVIQSDVYDENIVFDELVIEYGKRGITLETDLAYEDDSTHRSSQGRRNRSREKKFLASRLDSSKQVIGRVASFVPAVIHKRPYVNRMFESFIDAHPEYRHEDIHGKYYVQESNIESKEEHLKAFMGPSGSINPLYADSLGLAYDYVSKFFPIGALGHLRHYQPSLDGLELNSGPGLSYKLRGYGTKSDAVGVAMSEADCKFRRLLKGERVPPGLYWAGGRGKRCSNINKDDTIKKGRLIWMPEMDDTIIQNITLRPLTKLLTVVPGPWSVGDTFFYSGARSFEVFDRMGYNRGLFPDYQRFDGSISEPLVRLGISLLRRCYHYNRYDDAYWEYIIESSVKGMIVMPDNTIRYTNKGMKSGHSFTSLLECVINALMIYTVLIQLDGNHSSEFLDEILVKTMGDDSIIIGKEKYRSIIKKERFQYHMTRAFSVTVHPDKTFEMDTFILPSFSDFDNRDGIGYKSFQYLGKNIKNGRQWRPYKDTYSMLLYPEYPCESYSSEKFIASGHYIDCGNNYTMAMIRDYYEYLSIFTDEVTQPTSLGIRLPSVECSGEILKFAGLPPLVDVERINFGLVDI